MNKKRPVIDQTKKLHFVCAQKSNVDGFSIPCHTTIQYGEV